MHDRDKVLSNTPCLVPGGKRFGGKKYNNADSGDGLGRTWREERCDEDFTMECINVKTWLETQGRGQPHKQPLVSLELFMKLPGWLCPLRNIRAP